MSDSDRNRRLCSFRVREDIAQRLIDLGKLPEDYDRRTLSSSVMQLLEEIIEGNIPPKTSEEIKKQGRDLSDKLDYLTRLLEGKQSPQAA